jgi:hypothetical protein
VRASTARSVKVLTDGFDFHRYAVAVRRSQRFGLADRLERARQLADDLTRELVRAYGGGTPASRAMADAIKREVEGVLRALKRKK